MIIAINKSHKKYLKKLKNPKIKILVGGKTRAESSKICLNYLKKINPRNVFIHDAARPNFSVNLILKLLKGLKNNDGIVPVIDVLIQLNLGMVIKLKILIEKIFIYHKLLNCLNIKFC